MKYKMNQKERGEKWKEIIDTANNGDPEYSFRLFSELLDAKDRKVEKNKIKPVPYKKEKKQLKN